MPYPDNLLARGERVIVNKNPHWKVLVLPVLFFLLVVGGGVALLVWLQNWQYFHIAWIVIAAAMLIGVIWLVVVPVIRWRTEHFAISNHHVFFRTGLLSRREHQIPLGQIANMETEVTFWGRLMGFGTLVVESSADQPLKFHNIAELPKTQATLNQLIRDEREAYSRGRWGDDDFVDGPDDQDEAAAGPVHGHHSRREATYLDDERDHHPEPRSTPTRVFGAADDAPSGDRAGYPPATPYGQGPEQHPAADPAAWHPGHAPSGADRPADGGRPQYGTPPQAGDPWYGSAQPSGSPHYGPPSGPPQYGGAQSGGAQYGAPSGSPQYEQYGGAQSGGAQYGSPGRPPQYGAEYGGSQPSGAQYGVPSGSPQYGAPGGSSPYGGQPPSGSQYGEPDSGARSQYGPPQQPGTPPLGGWQAGYPPAAPPAGGQPAYGGGHAGTEPRYGESSPTGRPSYGAPQAPSGLPQYGQRPYDPSDPPTDPWLRRPGGGAAPDRSAGAPSGADGAGADSTGADGTGADGTPGREP